MKVSCSYHHCGITSSGSVTREGHCWCPECHSDPEPGFPESRIILAGVPDLPEGLPPGVPMCSRWYAGLGDYRPWLPPHDVHVIRTGTVTAISLDPVPGPHGSLLSPAYPAETGPE